MTIGMRQLNDGCMTMIGAEATRVNKPKYHLNH
jgi:hypothetical protein